MPAPKNPISAPPQSTLCIHIGSTHLRASQYDTTNNTPKILVFSNGFRHYRIPQEDIMIQSTQERAKLERKYLRHLIEESQMYFQSGTVEKMTKILQLDWFTSAWLAYMDKNGGVEYQKGDLPQKYTFMGIKWTGNSFQIKISRVVNGLMVVGQNKDASEKDLMTKPTIELDTLKLDKQQDDIIIEHHVYNHGELSTEDVKGISGIKIDEIVVDFLRKEFKKKYHIDVADNERAMRKLRNAAEVAKRTLSNTMSANIQIEALAEDIDFSIKLSLAKFEMLISPYINKACDELAALYKRFGGAVDYVALVGGSANIPIFKKKLAQFFAYHQSANPPKILDQIPPEEVSVYGAAIHTKALMSHLPVQKLKYTPSTLGVIHPVSRTFVSVIEKGSSLPVERTVTLKRDDGSASEENSTFSSDPNILSVVEEGEILLAEIPVHYEDSFEVTFKIDAKAVLTVSSCGQDLRFE